MAVPYIPQVVDAETTCEDAIITFSDGTSALFPAALLYSIIHRGKKLRPQPAARRLDPTPIEQ